MIKKCRNVNHFSNSYVENYFGNLKLNVLEGERNLKCSRFLRKTRETVLTISKEVELDLPKSSQTRQFSNTERGSQEEWKKKSRKIKTHFTGSFMKQVNNEKVTTQNVEESVCNASERCVYCGVGDLSTTEVTVLPKTRAILAILFVSSALAST